MKQESDGECVGFIKGLGASHLLLLWLPSRSPFSLRFRGGGLSTNEHSVPATRQATQLSSSSPMTQSVLRPRQASQGGADSPLTESESGESRPLRSPGYESRCMLLWRLGGKRLGFGAMAMGAVRGTAQGADMAKVKVGRRLTTGVTQFTLRIWLQFGKVSEDVTRRTVPLQPTQPQLPRSLTVGPSRDARGTLLPQSSGCL